MRLAVLTGLRLGQQFGLKWALVVFPSENPATRLDQRNFYARAFVSAV